MLIFWIQKVACWGIQITMDFFLCVCLIIPFFLQNNPVKETQCNSSHKAMQESLISLLL